MKKRMLVQVLVCIAVMFTVLPSVKGYAAWYDKYLNTCKELGALKNDTHDPNESLNRLETACLIDCISASHLIELPQKENTRFADIHICEKTSIESVLKLANADVINGYSDGTFKPYNNITRAEFAAILYKSFFLPDIPSENNPFRDVNKKQWFFESIITLSNKGVISGYNDPDGLFFKPNNLVTHAEACKMVLLAAEKSDLAKESVPSEMSGQTLKNQDIKTSSPEITMDATLERAIKAYLLVKKKIPVTESELSTPLSEADILSTEILSLKNCNLTSLEGLRRFKNIISLDISNNNISDISELAYLKNLNSIRVDNNKLSDISPLKNLTELEFFSADVNLISDFSPLTENKGLKSLYMKYNKNPDISFLSEFPLLDSLDISGNDICNINVLASLNNMQFLYMIENNVTDLSSLRNLPLIVLFIENNPISSYIPIENKKLLATDYKPNFR
ncbi:MAG TPA: S-layer homology domain-containing protein [Pseudobacteroides sp.]|uniref:S-layer homology domain-containing protein n=1 Tax=Pseudobacteroides sp. TaxID=1968840 RepID=UPI002F956D1C